MINNQMALVGQEDIAHRYGFAKHRWHVLDGGQVPTGYQLTVAGGCEVYTNSCAPQGTTWYTDGSRKGTPAGMGGTTSGLPRRCRTSLRAPACDWTSAGSSNPVPGGPHGHVCSLLPGTRW